MRRWHIPLGVVLLAYLLRTYTLDWQSFWIDEAHVVYFISHPLGETLHLIISPRHNGPLYFLLLWGWRQIAGNSDFALRYFSDLCSVLTVAVMWRLARSWFSSRVAGWTGLLLAIAPFAIWYGQEAKMYALHMLLATLAALFLTRALRASKSWPLWLAYGVTINLLGYSHFFGAFTIAAQALIVLLVTARQARRRRAYLLTMGIVALPYLPIVSFALHLLPTFHLQDISKGFMPLHFMLQELAAEYTLRVSRIYVVHQAALLIPLTFLLLVGLWTAWRRCWQVGLWVSGLLLLPTLIFYPISFKVPVFSPKYLSASFPYFILTLALALEWLYQRRRALAALGLLGMITVAGWENGRILTDPRLQRTDWRGAARYLAAHVQPDDAIVCFADYIHRPLNRYYHGPAPVLRFKADPYHPEAYYQGNLDEAGRHTMWLVLHQDQTMAPQHRLREAAAARYPQITAIYPNDGQIAILGYSVHWRHETLPAAAVPLEARFSNGLALVGYQVDATRLPPTDNNFHPPSNWLHVTTYWRVWRDAPTAFTPYVHLTDASGGVWGGELPRPPTVFDFDPPAQWGAAIVEAHYDVNLNPVTPPGTYRLAVGLTDAAGNPIPLTSGDADVTLRDIEITPPTHR